MATILYIGTYGTDDLTRATMPFHMASGALDAGHEPGIVLAGEASYLLKSGVIEEVRGLGIPPLAELMAKMIQHHVPIYVYGGCAKARGALQSDLEGKNASFITSKDLADLTVAADRVVTI